MMNAILKTYLLPLFVVLAIPSSISAQSILIDDFSTSQGPVIDALPGVPLAHDTIGPNIIGLERDLSVQRLVGGIGDFVSAAVGDSTLSISCNNGVTGRVTVIWDGQDMAPAVADIDHSGLGGLDLTNSGTQNALELYNIATDLASIVTITVYTSSTSFSSYTLMLPSTNMDSISLILPYSEFNLGMGATSTVNFANVGAISLSIEGNELDAEISLLRTTSVIDADLTATLIGDSKCIGLVDVGDTIQYIAKVSNPDDSLNIDVTNAVYTIPTLSDAELIVGTVTTTQGAVTTGNTSGDASVEVQIGTITDGDTVCITFDAKVISVPADDTLSVQGTVVSDQGTIRTNDSATTSLTPDSTKIFIKKPAEIINVTAEDIDSTYGICDTICIQVIFDQKVIVSGTPTLMLNIMPSPKVVDYYRGSGTDTLVFKYVVGLGEMTPDLSYMASSSIGLTSMDSIRDTMLCDANVELPSAAGSLSANKDIVINGKITPVMVEELVCQGETYISPGGKMVTRDTVMLLDTITSARGCDSILSINVKFSQLCGNSIKFKDPCRCDNPLNNRVAGVLYFQDTLIVTTAMAVDSILLAAPLSGLFKDAAATAYAAGDKFTVNPSNPLEWKMEIWRPSGVQPVASVTTYKTNGTTVAAVTEAIPAMRFQPLCSEAACNMETVPTLSEWSLILLGLIMLIVSTAAIQQKELVTSLLG